MMKYRWLGSALAIGIAVPLLAGLLTGGCGRKASLPPVGRGLRAPPSCALPEALSDLDALPTPEGVDDALFSSLKSALADALHSSLTPDPSSLSPAKLASRAPTGEPNRVDDLELVDNGDGTYTLTWSYRNAGDYNQDGIVGIQDLTPLAVHFNESADETNEWVDGNGDGVINIQDVTPLAANFATACAGYSVQGADTSDGPWSQFDRVLLMDATGEGRLRFRVEVASPTLGYARALPFDWEDNSGVLSSSVMFPGEPWVHTWGGSSLEEATAIAVDSHGGIYVTGHTTSFSAGDQDVFLLKYSANGKLVWQRAWGGTGDDGTNALAADESGSVYAAGFTHSTDTNSRVLLLLKYDPGGNLIWERTWRREDSSRSYASAISVDVQGNVYVTGCAVNGTWQPILLKYDSAGNLIWQRRWSTDGSATAQGIAADTNGNVYVAGTINGRRICLLKFLSSGDLSWQREWAGNVDMPSSGEAVGVDEDGNVYVAGRTQIDAGLRWFDAVLLKYDLNGDLLWQRTWGGDSDDRAYGLAIDTDGNVCVTGCSGSFGTHMEPLLLWSEADGHLGSRTTWHSYDEARARVVAVDGAGRLYVAGWSPKSLGYWQSVTGQTSSSVGSTQTPDGSASMLEGTESIPSGSVSVPEGVEDEGGGDRDVLIIRYDPE